MNNLTVSSTHAEPVSPVVRSGDRQRLWRRFKDRAATVSISAGGMGVLVAILLIFFYLLYEILPLFQSASMEPVAEYPVSRFAERAGAPLYTAMEEQSEIGMRLDQSGRVDFFRLKDGAPLQSVELPIPAGVSIGSFALDSEQNRIFALGLSDGSVLVARHHYKVTYPDGERLITPVVQYPFGDQPVRVADAALDSVAVRDTDEGLVIAASVRGDLVGRRWKKEEDFLSGEVTLKEVEQNIPDVDILPKRLLISPDQQLLYAVSVSGAYRVIDLRDERQIDSGQLFNNARLTELRFLLGGISLLVGTDRGDVSQWFMVRQPDSGSSLTRIRSFDTGNAAVTGLATEHRRKGFLSIDAEQRLSVFYTTSERLLLQRKLAESPIRALAISPRADAVLAETEAGNVKFLSLHNEHPEVSWSALWNKVWYESYPEPDFIWQSSAANNDFEPKFSLTPLAFGTLKAAFYAMIIAAPLAICGAIYTAYFMAPALRRKIKPLIELMEALPTVILGFLAGLWLAPFIEKHLPGVFAVLLLMPVGVLLFAFAWNSVPIRFRKYVPDGWAPLLLVPVMVLLALGAIGASGQMEQMFFSGDMRAWLTNDLGISFDQRNALVVGIAMGFAVIPTIFSIAEDAIFSVPKHLSYGSLALGATPWQTLVGVVMPTASPGIFSALMIGMGRAVGETMIVLMATGNTPIMDLNIFEGMRTLSANIAVEIGETEVDSTHFRVLFLAAFVLFMFTFVVNTLAEIIRQRLRERYGSI